MLNLLCQIDSKCAQIYYFVFFLFFIEPIEIITESQEIPWHYIVPSSVLAVSALIVALCVNFIRLRKAPKLVVSI